MRKPAAAFAVLLLFCAPAFAQKGVTYQGGTATPGDLPKMQSNGAITSSGSINGDKSGKGVNPFSINNPKDEGLCFRTGPSGSAHNALCVGHDTQGNGIISLDSYGGMGPKKLYFKINGVLHEATALNTGGGGGGGDGGGTTTTLLALHSGGCLALHSGGCLALHGP